MVFSSSLFLFYFLPAVFLAYFASMKLFGTGVSNIVLLAFSLFFYSWGEGLYLFIMVVSIIMNFFIGVLIQTSRFRRSVLNIGVLLNLALLIYYKYIGFIVQSVIDSAAFAGIAVDFTAPEVHLPIGISFFTFQAISYIIDVYRNEAKAQRNVLNLGLYISLFPQLIAGPIVRYSTVDAEIRERTITLSAVATGLRLFVVGLFMKVALADTMAYTVDTLAEYPVEALSSGTSWMLAISYSFQIFFDFAGYSLMAIGLGRAFGFTFPSNFDQPYTSLSIQEFWRRWHISLSSWFRDYLYIFGLGGNRRGAFRTYVNLGIVFFATGIWHGASWSFVFWGFMHGFFIILERTGALSFLQQLPKLFQRLYLLLVVITAWVFFRVEDFGDAVIVVKNMYVPTDGGHPLFSHISMHTNLMYWTVFAICLVWAFASPNTPKIVEQRASQISASGWDAAKSFGALLLLVISLLIVVSNTYSSFIYFRF